MSRYTPPGTAPDPNGTSAFELKRRRRLRIVAALVCVSLVLPVFTTLFGMR